MKIFNLLVSNRRIIAINFIILLFFLVTPSIALFSYRTTKNIIRKTRGLSLDSRSNFKGFENKIISNKVFKEKDQLDLEFRSFLGWRPKNVEFKYTKVQNPYNTRYSIGQNLSDSTWFFGGSTIWGFGVPDHSTIPSLYALKTKNFVFNFGEQAWVSRQSLNQLISVLGDGHKPKSIIFYGGANDITVGCRNYHNYVPTYSQQQKLENLIEDQYKIINLKKISEFLKEPYILISKKLIKKNLSNTNYNCINNNDKSKLIAKHLVNNWYIAFLISQSYDLPFYAVLQPHIDIDGFNFKNLNLSSSLEELRTYEEVYPLIKEEVKKKCLVDPLFCSKFIDGSSWINPNENLFFDTLHLTKQGNQFIVDELSKLDNGI